MDQDDDWVKSNLTLDENLYYKDFLHLAESGKEKLNYLFIFKAVFNRTQTSIIIITIIFMSIRTIITFTIIIITTFNIIINITITI